MAKKKLSILFATFSSWKNGRRLAINGMVEPMLSFFLPKTNKFVLLDQPYPGSDKFIPIVEFYKNGKLVRKTESSFLSWWLYPLLILRNKMGTRIPFKIRDFLSVLDFVVWNKEKFDLFIGLESINALAGALLKKLGRVKKVVYYVSDYSPNRYKRGWFNAIYLFLDRLAATKADFIWDVSVAMLPARIKAGLEPMQAAPVIHVPNALFPKQINYYPLSKILPYSLVYAGTLGKENGPDLAIKSLKIVSKKFPKSSLHFFGGGEKDLERLKNLAKKFNVDSKVTFHGFISDQILLSKTIGKYKIGLAPYKAISGDPRWWADATKIRLYLAAGLPVITTQVPPLGKELTRDQAGLVVKDVPDEVAAAIIQIFENKNLYKELRKNAIKKARGNTWKNTYSSALAQMKLDNGS